MPTSHTFMGSPLDRASHLRRDEAWLVARLAERESRVLPMWRLKALVIPGREPAIAWQPAVEIETFAGPDSEAVFLGLGQGIAHFAANAAGEDDPAEGGTLGGKGKFIDVRTIAPQLAAGEAAILAQARSLVDWHARHRFCAVCGRPTAPEEGGHSRRCRSGACGAQHFPRTDPVVIMLV
ncbi:MAG: NUDIX-like domain-containing protein, partial [Alphaproteobacteria bacterium]